MPVIVLCVHVFISIIRHIENIETLTREPPPPHFLTHTCAQVGSAIASQPSFHPRIPDTSVTPYANATDLMQAWRLLLGASSIDPTGTTTGMLYDVIDVGQMVGSAVFLGHLKDLEVAFNARNTSGVQSAGKALLATVADVDALLHTSPNHLFGTYLLSAETSGNSADEISMFRTAAKRLVTLWGYPMANGTAAQTSHNSGLSEYAYRLWAGLVSTYYQPRWCIFRCQTAHIHMRVCVPRREPTYTSTASPVYKYVPVLALTHLY